jgi:hypothetical protein
MHVSVLFPAGNRRDRGSMALVEFDVQSRRSIIETESVVVAPRGEAL